MAQHGATGNRPPILQKNHAHLSRTTRLLAADIQLYLIADLTLPASGLSMVLIAGCPAAARVAAPSRLVSREPSLFAPPFRGLRMTPSRP